MRPDDAVAEARQRLAGSVWTWWVGADSDEGRPVYRRIGFEIVSHYRLFAFGE